MIYNMECIMHGWLTKSPPEKKTQGPWKLFKAKWRRRFFVLNEVPAAQSLPGHRAALLYFDSESMKHKLGQIDLSSCDEVQQRLESSFYKHVFSLRTKHKGKDRTYYLVAESDPEMNKWVDCLCCVLGLKETDCEQKVDISPALLNQSQEAIEANQHPQICTNADNKIISTYGRPAPHDIIGDNVENVKGEQYIHLDECWTGPKRIDFSQPPALLDTCTPLPLNAPRERSRLNLGGPPNHNMDRMSSTYDKPRSYNHDLSCSSECVDSHLTRSAHGYDEYDIPKKLGPVLPGDQDDTYDIPRSTAPLPGTTECPPYYGQNIITQQGGGVRDERYINLPDNSKCHPGISDSTYDFPSRKEPAADAESVDTALLELTPPPPSHMPKSHKYVNAKAGFVNMTGPVSKISSSGQWESESPESKTSQNTHKQRFGEDLQAVVPRPGLTLSTVDESHLPKPGTAELGSLKNKDNQKLLLFSNHRTRSFKRNISSSTSNIPLPIKKDGGLTDNSSSDEEDDQVVKKMDKDAGLFNSSSGVMFPPKKSLNSTPPPPPASALEVQYLDLDLSADKPPSKNEFQSTISLNKEQSSPSISTTDYKEIDFVKTKALGRMKQDVEKKRLSSEQSTDES